MIRHSFINLCKNPNVKLFVEEENDALGLIFVFSYDYRNYAPKLLSYWQISLKFFDRQCLKV
jgi:hypothetical protein